MAQIIIKNIKKTYQPFATVALKNIDITLESKEFFTLVGPSGCGKTTLLRCIAGIERVDQGDIFFDGQNMNKVPVHQRQAAMVFQGILLFPHLSIFENIAFGLRVRKYEHSTIKEEVEQVLAQMQMSHLSQKKPHQISGGEQQRAALARALVIRPKILLLDEPLASLDRHLWRDMSYLIKNLHNQYQITTVLATHNQEEALLLGDRVAVMFKGQIMQIGKDIDLYQQPNTLETAKFFDVCNVHDAHKKGNRIVTKWGDIHINKENYYRDCTDGDVVLGIRPENIAYGTHKINSLHGKVMSSHFTSTHWRSRISTPHAEWDIISNEHRADGDMVHIYLPPEHIMLFPK